MSGEAREDGGVESFELAKALPREAKVEVGDQSKTLLCCRPFRESFAIQRELDRYNEAVRSAWICVELKIPASNACSHSVMTLATTDSS